MFVCHRSLTSVSNCLHRAEGFFAGVGRYNKYQVEATYSNKELTFAWEFEGKREKTHIHHHDRDSNTVPHIQRVLNCTDSSNLLWL